MDFATRADVTGRLRGLVIMLDEALSTEQQRSAEALIDESEFGPALEVLADWLAENETPILADVRRDFERLSTQVGNAEAVMGSLAACPVQADDA
jgi:hypothetical protein